MIKAWISVKYISLIVTVSQGLIIFSDPITKTQKLSQILRFFHIHFFFNSSRFHQILCNFFVESSSTGVFGALFVDIESRNMHNSNCWKQHPSMEVTNFLELKHCWAVLELPIIFLSTKHHLFAPIETKIARISHCDLQEVGFRNL